jgi:hypothetical protein
MEFRGHEEASMNESYKASLSAIIYFALTCCLIFNAGCGKKKVEATKEPCPPCGITFPWYKTELFEDHDGGYVKASFSIDRRGSLGLEVEFTNNSMKFDKRATVMASVAFGSGRPSLVLSCDTAKVSSKRYEASMGKTVKCSRFVTIDTGKFCDGLPTGDVCDVRDVTFEFKIM